MRTFGRRSGAPPATPVSSSFGANRPSPQKLVVTPIPPPQEPGNSASVLDHRLIGATAERIHDLVTEALTVDGGIHVETLMSSLGALAGFSAQNAVLRSVVDTGLMPLHGGLDLQAGAFVIVATDSGENFYFGDIVNSFLIPEPNRFGPAKNMALAQYLAEACANAGAAPIHWEEIKALFAHVSASIASEQFGIPRLPPQHKPHFLPQRALNMLWPAVADVLGHPLQDGRRIPAECWPLGIGLASAVLIERTKDVLSPTLSMRIVLEAAVPMSKVDPANVPGARGVI